jgi:hypothetical protein
MADFEESGLPEEALEMFSMKQVILVSFRTSDPKVFGFERSSQIIGIRTLYLDWETNGKCGDTNSRTEPNKFITELADQEQFKNVSKKEFPDCSSKFSEGLCAASY